MTFSERYHDGLSLAIKRIHDLPPYLSYVSTLYMILHKKTKTYVVFLSIVSGSEKNRFGGPEVPLNKADCVVNDLLLAADSGQMSALSARPNCRL